MRIRIARGFLTSRFGLALLGTGAGPAARGHGCLRLLLHSIWPSDRPAAHRPDLPEHSRVYSGPGPHLRRAKRCAPAISPAICCAPDIRKRMSPALPGEFHRRRDRRWRFARPPDSYFQGNNALRVDFSGSEISHISQLSDGAELDSAEIEPRGDHQSLRQLPRKAPRSAL